MRTLLLGLLMLAGSLLALPAEARITAVMALDGGIATADKVFIGTVTQEHTLVKSEPGPFGSTVKRIMLHVLVDVPLVNTKTGEDVSVEHLVVLPTSAPTINGFGPVTLDKGTTYLFFVKATSAGRFELLVIEDYHLVQLKPAFVPPLVAIAKRHKGALDQAVEVLLHVVATCKTQCSGAIRLLARSKKITGPPIRKRPFKSKAAAAKARKVRQLAAARRKRFSTAMVRVVHRSDDDNTLNAAFTHLGRLGVTSVIPRLVRLACQDPKTTKRSLSNTVNWLQGFTPKQQIAPLEAIIAHAKDPSVARYARTRLSAAKNRL